MAIAYDNGTGPFVNNPVTSQTTAFTVGTNSDRFIYVWILGDAAATTGISGVTYAGVSMTKLDTHRVSTDRSFDVWYLVAPATGSNNVVISRGASGLIVSGFVSYDGVDQTTPIPTSAKTTDAASNTTVNNATITTTIDDSWAIFGGRDNGGRTISGGTGLTVRVTNVGNGMHLGDSNGVINPAGSHTFNGTYNIANLEAHILFELAVSGGAPPAASDNALAICNF